MCTYESPTSLFPPTELLSIGGVLNNNNFLEIKLLDAIALQLSEGQCTEKINQFSPDYIVTLLGFETFESDILFIKNLAAYKVICFGHYPTLFSKEILENSNIEYIIKGEPEFILSTFFHQITEGSFSPISGLIQKNKDNIESKTPRLKSRELVFKPNLKLLNTKNYFEPLLPEPLGIIQSARGCPYQCNFCVKSYGTQLTYKTENQIIEELIDWKEIFGAKSIRFIDDTFTISEQRVLKICALIEEQKINLPWACLSRLDTLTEKMVAQMKKAGCQRIYFGIESGSQKVLDFYKKDYNIKTARAALDLCKKYQIESVGFFMAGLPIETDNDFLETINFIKTTPLTYAGIGELTLYPGTQLFNLYRDEINFSLFPYVNEFKNPEIKRKFRERKTLFEKEFYTSKKLFQLARLNAKRPIEILNLGKKIIASQKKGFYKIVPSILKS